MDICGGYWQRAQMLGIRRCSTVGFGIDCNGGSFRQFVQEKASIAKGTGALLEEVCTRTGFVTRRARLRTQFLGTVSESTIKRSS